MTNDEAAEIKHDCLQHIQAEQQAIPLLEAIARDLNVKDGKVYVRREARHGSDFEIPVGFATEFPFRVPLMARELLTVLRERNSEFKDAERKKIMRQSLWNFFHQNKEEFRKIVRELDPRMIRAEAHTDEKGRGR